VGALRAGASAGHGITVIRALNAGDEQRKIESGHFKLFRAQVPDFPDGEVWHVDAPDFLVMAADGECLESASKEPRGFVSP